MVLTPQQAAELEFWKGLVAQYGEYYYAYRCAEYYEKTRYFPTFLARQGIGLDLGAGCISVFEGCSKPVLAYDALSQYYMQLLPEHIERTLRVSYLRYIKSIGADWVACINMIDHTPDPASLIQQIRYECVRKTDIGDPPPKLYFEVNLEQGLATPHYHVWTLETVREFLNLSNGFLVTHSYVQDVPEHRQQRYWAEYDIL